MRKIISLMLVSTLLLSGPGLLAMEMSDAQVAAALDILSAAQPTPPPPPPSGGSSSMLPPAVELMDIEDGPRHTAQSSTHLQRRHARHYRHSAPSGSTANKPFDAGERFANLYEGADSDSDHDDLGDEGCSKLREDVKRGRYNDAKDAIRRELKANPRTKTALKEYAYELAFTQGNQPALYEIARHHLYTLLDPNPAVSGGTVPVTSPDSLAIGLRAALALLCTTYQDAEACFQIFKKNKYGETRKLGELSLKKLYHWVKPQIQSIDGSKVANFPTVRAAAADTIATRSLRRMSSSVAAIKKPEVAFLMRLVTTAPYGGYSETSSETSGAAGLVHENLNTAPMTLKLSALCAGTNLDLLKRIRCEQAIETFTRWGRYNSWAEFFAQQGFDVDTTAGQDEEME